MNILERTGTLVIQPESRSVMLLWCSNLGHFLTMKTGSLYTLLISINGKVFISFINLLLLYRHIKLDIQQQWCYL
jgi:hypothetical protein